MAQPYLRRLHFRWRRRPTWRRLIAHRGRLRRYLELEILEGRLAPAALVPSAIRPGFDTATLEPSDDGSTGLISLGFGHALNFYGNSFSGVYINDNGNLTFNAPLSAYTPFNLQSDVGTPIIAPFFADVWTYGNSGRIDYGSGTVEGHAAFAVEWPGVSYYSNNASDKLNTFQVVLIDRSDTGPGNFDIEFDYGHIEWETGDSSGGNNGLGGTSARAGFSSGTGQAGTSFELPGSGVNGALLDANRTGLIHGSLNSSVPGRYVLAIRGIPTEIGLSDSSIPENSLSGAVVGLFSTADPQPGASYIYSLVDGPGSNGNSAFTISGNQLLTSGTFDYDTQPAWGIRVRSTDQNGVSVDKTFTINIRETSPTDIQLDNTTLLESMPVGSAVGNLATRAPEAPGQPPDHVTYSLVGDDVNAFGIQGSRLVTNTSFDFDSQNSYRVVIRSTDDAGLYVDKAFTITITDAAPGDIALDNQSLSETSVPGSVVGKLTAMVPEGTGQPADRITYSLVGGDVANFAISDNRLITSTVFDFVTRSRYSVVVRATSASGLYLDKQFDINITQAPAADITLDGTSVPENAVVGSLVGKLTSTTMNGPAQPAVDYTCSLVGGSGPFTIIGDELVTNATLDFETQNTYSVTVRSTNASGLSFDKTFTINITDVPPVISLPATGRATAGSAFGQAGSIIDPGPGQDAFSVAVDYGDSGQSAPPQTLPSVPVAGQNPYSFSLDHVYTATGDFTVTVSVFNNGRLVGSLSMVVHVVTAAQNQEIESSDTEVITGSGTAQASADDNSSVEATLNLGSAAASAILWVVNYKGNPAAPSTNSASAAGTIEVGSGASSAASAASPLAFYDVRVSGVSSADTNSQATVEYTVSVPASQVAKGQDGSYHLLKPMDVLFFDGQQWQVVQSDPQNQEQVSVTLDQGKFVAVITVTYDTASSPTLAELNGTVFTVALPAPPLPAPTALPVAVSGLSAYPTLPTANFASSAQATVIFRGTHVSDLSSSTTELSTRTAGGFAAATTTPDDAEALTREFGVDWLMRVIDSSSPVGAGGNIVPAAGAAQPREQPVQQPPTNGQQSVVPASGATGASPSGPPAPGSPAPFSGSSQDEIVLPVENLLSLFSAAEAPVLTMQAEDVWTAPGTEADPRALAMAVFLALGTCEIMRERDEQDEPSSIHVG